MDCRTALEILDLVHSYSGDRKNREVEAAEVHLTECPQCYSRFERRQAFDQTVARVMKDVPVPPGLKEKLLNELQVGDFSTVDTIRSESTECRSSDGTYEPIPGRNVSRRKWFRYLISAAVSFAAGIALWWVFSSQDSNLLTMDQIRSWLRTMNNNLESLSEFDGNFTASLPRDGWNSGGIRFTTPAAKGFHKNRDGNHLMALYEFRFIGREGSSLTGILLVIPESRIEDPPAAAYFSTSSAGYEPVPHAVWKSNGLVYVCLIPDGDARALDLLQRALRSGLV